MQKLYLKIKDHWIFWVATILFTWFLGKKLDYLYDNKLFGEIPDLVVKIISFRIAVPVVPLILTTLLSSFLYKIFRKFKNRKNELKIISAIYGAKNKYINVTNELDNLIFENKLKIIIGNNIAGDPIYGVPKKAKISYSFRGKKFEITCDENELLELPKLGN